MAVTTDSINALNILPSTVPATKGWAITASDTNYLTDNNDGVNATVTRGILVDVAGTIAVVFAGQTLAQAVTQTVLAGVMYPWAVKMVKSTGTTATGIKGYR